MVGSLCFHQICLAHRVRVFVRCVSLWLAAVSLSLQGNFAQFLESADSVVSLAPEGGGSGSSSSSSSSFVNMFALPELKVRRGEGGEGGGTRNGVPNEGGGCLWCSFVVCSRLCSCSCFRCCCCCQLSVGYQSDSTF